MRNWNVKEAVQVLNEGTDKEAIKEIVKHFPMFAVIAASTDFNGLAQSLPDSVTVRKVEMTINGVGAKKPAEAPKKEEAKQKKSAKVEKAVEEEDTDLEEKSVKELIAMCEDAGLKVPKAGKNKKFYIDKLLAAGVSEDTEEEEEEEDEQEEKTPVELFKECKKAGLNVPKGKSAKFYQSKLDELAEQEEEDDDTDDWDDEEEEEEEKPKKAGKKADKKEKKSAKKASKKEEEEDDDDDWDI